MSARYVARQGDVLDMVCRTYYGRSDVLQAVLEANPGLSRVGPILPAGLTITLPDLPPPPTTGTVRLWD